MPFLGKEVLVNRRILFITIAVTLAVIFGSLLFFMIGRSYSAHLQVKANKTKVASINSLIAQAGEFQAKGNLPEAKALWRRLINEYPNSNDAVNWQKKIDDLNIKLLFSPVLTPRSVLYEIKPGDTLFKIAQEFKTTPELIMKSNNLSEDKIFPRRKIKIWTAPFSLLAYKSQNILILKSADEIIKTYVVSTGANNCTPVGTFKITTKLVNPTWFKSGAVVPPNSQDNILGSRWMGFNLAGYGIHGTVSPQDLGKQVTQGCIRMANSDVEELYAIIPIGTEVTIVE